MGVCRVGVKEGCEYVVKWFVWRFGIDYACV